MRSRLSEFLASKVLGPLANFSLCSKVGESAFRCSGGFSSGTRELLSTAATIFQLLRMRRRELRVDPETAFGV